MCEGKKSTSRDRGSSVFSPESCVPSMCLHWGRTSGFSIPSLKRKYGTLRFLWGPSSINFLPSGIYTLFNPSLYPGSFLLTQELPTAEVINLVCVVPTWFVSNDFLCLLKLKTIQGLPCNNTTLTFWDTFLSEKASVCYPRIVCHLELPIPATHGPLSSRI